ncbi:hypothetical protein [Pontibacter sp. SGAir0037]|uniref:hypothetical protein n=1 Tax=Pontibacter sp. SGAir0037 TaxID=2571030 RepID=UPI0010F76404|nr:hypothetical protein [Pontibacter sp. SGAir0037]
MPDTAFIQVAVSNATEAYKSAVGIHAHLYTGPEYVNHRKQFMEGHQFFETNQLSEGSVLYDGAWYQQVPMFYDVVTDEIILYNSGFSQKLVSKKVKTFYFLNHKFERFEHDSTGAFPYQSGFYDVLHEGSVQLLAKRVKVANERATSQGMEGDYSIADKYFLEKDGKYQQVKNKRSLYKALQTNKKQLNEYVRANKIKFRKNREEAMARVVGYYDSLNP